jgi:hypothetical protein
MRLVKESETVIQARARIERDVKGFLKTGLAAEHHRVGLLLNEILREALNIDWASAAVRRKGGPCACGVLQLEPAFGGAAALQVIG